MIISATCPECKEEISMRTLAPTRTELAMDKGEIITLKCKTCNRDCNFPVDDFVAKPSRFAIFILLVFITTSAFSQDLIISRNKKDTMKCTILIDTCKTLYYRMFNSLDTATYSLKSNEYDSYILSDKKSTKNTPLVMIYKKGIYRSFEEFKANMPSFTDTFQLIRRPDSSYILKTFDKYGDLYAVQGDIWGFSDGYNIFSYQNFDYRRLNNIEYYSIMEFEEINIFLTAIDDKGQRVKNKSVYVLEYSTGQVYELTNFNMKKILLVSDNELLEKYKSDAAAKEKIKEYIEIFNEKNKIDYPLLKKD